MLSSPRIPHHRNAGPLMSSLIISERAQKWGRPEEDDQEQINGGEAHVSGHAAQGHEG